MQTFSQKVFYLHTLRVCGVNICVVCLTLAPYVLLMCCNAIGLVSVFYLLVRFCRRAQ